jgi:ribosomal protein S18 acetylase RimI-like enzyme
VTLLPARDFSPPELAAAFTDGYDGYRFPVRLDDAAFLAMQELSDLDLARSRVAIVDGRAVGICLLGVRGRQGWIGGLGVVPAERRRGLGRRLMEAALEDAAVERVSLEVLEGNAGALALYEALGFRPTRLLEVWTLEASVPVSAARAADLDEALAAIRRLRAAPEPWQRADESVANLRRGGKRLEAFALGEEGAAVARPAGETVSLLQLAAREADAAAALVAAARRLGTTLRFVNVPKGDPASAALRELGGRLDARQVEMATE